MTTSETGTEATAFLVMAQNLRAALSERDELVRPYREYYDRAHDGLQLPPRKRVKIAEEFVRAACRADHFYEERVEEGLQEYRRLMNGEIESRY